MQIIPLSASNEKNNIYIQEGLLSGSAALFGPFVHDAKAYVITDATIYESHGTVLVQNLLSAGAKVHVLTVESEENAKRFSKTEKLYMALIEDGIDETDILVAFGGRNIQDITGFVAASLLGGIRYISVPTTIASQAFLFPSGYPCLTLSLYEKNIGAKHLPLMVLNDPTLLKTLPPRQQSSGMAEIIQHAAVCDGDLFRLIETFGVTAAGIGGIITSCCKKRSENIQLSHRFGAEFAHILRKHASCTYTYGEALSVAMARSVAVGVRDLKTSEEAANRLIRLLNKFSLPVSVSPEDEAETETAIKSMEQSESSIVFISEIGKSCLIRTTLSCLLPKAYANRLRLEITPSVPEGTLRIPPCRDIALKMLIAAFLSHEENPVSGQGLLFEQMKEALLALSSTGELPGGQNDIIMHYLLPLALSVNGGVTVHGESPINKERLAPVKELLDAHGIVYHTEEHCFTAYGRLKGGEFRVQVSQSPYLVCGLLMILPCLKETSTLTIEGDLTHMFHVEITLEIMKKYGIDITRLTERTFSIRGNQSYKSSDVPRFVGGDYAIASAFWAMGAINGNVGCLVLADGKNQPAFHALPIAENFGATIVQEGGRISVSAERLLGAGIDLMLAPDLFPYVLALSACAEGESRLFNADILRDADSDHFNKVIEAFSSIGISIRDEGDYLSVYGSSSVPGGAVDVSDDPILALCLCALSPKAKDKIILLGGQCILSIMPDFLSQAQAIGLDVSMLGEIE